MNQPDAYWQAHSSRNGSRIPAYPTPRSNVRAHLRGGMGPALEEGKAVREEGSASGSKHSQPRVRNIPIKLIDSPSRAALGRREAPIPAQKRQAPTHGQKLNRFHSEIPIPRPSRYTYHSEQKPNRPGLVDPIPVRRGSAESGLVGSGWQVVSPNNGRLATTQSQPPLSYNLRQMSPDYSPQRRNEPRLVAHYYGRQPVDGRRMEDTSLNHSAVSLPSPRKRIQTIPEDGILPIQADYGRQQLHGQQRYNELRGAVVNDRLDWLHRSPPPSRVYAPSNDTSAPPTSPKPLSLLHNSTAQGDNRGAASRPGVMIVHESDIIGGCSSSDEDLEGEGDDCVKECDCNDGRREKGANIEEGGSSFEITRSAEKLRGEDKH